MKKIVAETGALAFNRAMKHLAAIICILGLTITAQAQKTKPAAPEAAVPKAGAAATPIPTSPNFTLGWTDPNNAQGTLGGYKISYGTTSGNYTTTVDVPGQAGPGEQKTKAFTNFPLGTYFFIVKAYTTAGVLGVASGEISAQVIQQPQAPVGFGIVSTGLVNMSTRGKVIGGDEVLIGGFTVQDDSKVAVRAIGPSLAQFGLAALKEASVELHDSTGALMKSNNGWRTGPDAEELKRVSLAPSSDAESALIAVLGKGQYTAIVKGGADAGIGMVELYRLTE